jgi:hypothetical protein
MALGSLFDWSFGYGYGGFMNLLAFAVAVFAGGGLIYQGPRKTPAFRHGDISGLAAVDIYVPYMVSCAYENI